MRKAPETGIGEDRRAGKWEVIRKSKGNKDRIIPISRTMVEDLRRYWKYHRHHRSRLHHPLQGLARPHRANRTPSLRRRGNDHQYRIRPSRSRRQSFDAWGERRDPGSHGVYRAAAADPFRTGSPDFNRGFTGHEQLDDSGLIHMNGRIYDPELGRMLSPDPYVQVPEYSQNFNRYSYVMNNPLNLTDPSGFSWLGGLWSKAKDWVGENWRTLTTIVVAAVLILTPGGQAFVGAIAGTLFPGAVAAGGGWALAAGGAVVGGITGGLGSALNGGGAGDILRGTLVGAIQGAIAGGVLHGMEANAVGALDKALHIAGHGLLGGAANAAMGGKFQDGFLSAAVAAYASWTFMKNTTYLKTVGSTGVGRTVAAGIVGGTASALGGGKFANGAYTAAFQHLLNAEIEKRKKVYDVIAYNGDDPGRDGVANGKAMERAAKSQTALFENHKLVDFSSVKDLVSQLEVMREDGQIRTLMIFDHGNKRFMEIGDARKGDYIEPNSDSWTAIAKQVMRGGAIHLCGCGTGGNAFNANMYARFAPGRNIATYRNAINIGPRGVNLVRFSPVSRYSEINEYAKKIGF